MKEKDETDLFDFLGISTYEHSYTKLLEALFKERKDWAHDFFEEVWGYPPLGSVVRSKTQLSIPREGSKRGRDRLDLVLVFGEVDPYIWIIEAKIKSGESSDQLQRYESKGAQQHIANEFGLAALPPQEQWLYSYMTLEKEEPSQTQRFRPSDYRSILKVLSGGTAGLPEEILPAYECLRERLRDYYDIRDNVLSNEPCLDGKLLREYLSHARGLVDKTIRFHWLVKQIAEENGMLPEAGKTEQGVPFCKMRPNHWQGQSYIECRPDTSKCFDIHFELQLIQCKTIKLKLHYETNPYMRKQDMEKLPKDHLEGYRESKKKFVQALDSRKHDFRNAEWEYTSLRYSLQLARATEALELENDVSISSLRQWVRVRTQAVCSVIDHTGKETGLWR